MGERVENMMPTPCAAASDAVHSGCHSALLVGLAELGS